MKREITGNIVENSFTLFFLASLGGPLIIRDVNGKKSESTSTSDTLSNHVDALIGIVSWGSQCGLANYPG